MQIFLGSYHESVCSARFLILHRKFIEITLAKPLSTVPDVAECKTVILTGFMKDRILYSLKVKLSFYNRVGFSQHIFEVIICKIAFL